MGLLAFIGGVVFVCVLTLGVFKLVEIFDDKKGKENE